MEHNKSKLYVGYHLITSNQIDDRLVLEKSELNLVNATSTDDHAAQRFPQTYFAVATDSEDGAQFYILDQNAPADPETGLYHLVDYPYILHHPYINSEEVIGDHDGAYYHLQDQLFASEGIELLPAVKSQIIRAKIDNDTIIFTSEGKMATSIQPGKAIDTEGKKINVRIDSETVKLDVVNNRLFVPIDRDTIYVTSEGKIAARPEYLKNGIATHAYYDGDSEVVDVLVDGVTIKVNAANQLYVEAAIEAGNGIELSAGSSAAAKKVNVAGSDTITVDSEVHVKHDGKTIVVGASGIEVPIDGTTITLGTDNKLHSTGVVEGIATTVTKQADNKQKIDVNVDNITVKANASNKLAVQFDPNGAISTTANGLTALVDGQTIKIDGNKLVSGIKSGAATNVHDAQVDVIVDNVTTEIASNKVKAKLDPLGGLEVKTNGIGVKADGTTVQIDATTGELHAKSVNQGIANEITAANVLNVKYDNTSVKVNGLNQLIVPVDQRTIVADTTSVRANIDNKTIVYDTTETALSVKPADGTIEKTTAGIRVPIDGTSIVLDGGKVKAKIVEDKGIKLDTTGGQNKIGARVDDTTIKFRTDGAMYAVDELPFHSAADKYKELGVKADGTLEWQQSSRVFDVQINGTSIVPTDATTGLPTGTANIPIASGELGAVLVDGNRGIKLESASTGKLMIIQAEQDAINNRNDTTVSPALQNAAKFNSIVPNNIDAAVKAALCDGKGAAYTVAEQKAAQERLGIGIGDFSTWDMTGNKINLSMDTSEYKLTFELLTSEGNLLDSKMIDLPLEEMIIDGYYVDKSEGGYIVLTLKNGHQVIIPLDQLVDGLVTLRTDQNVTGSKNFQGGLYQNGLPVLSAWNLDGVTLKWSTSEQKAYATGLEVAAGTAVEVVNGGTSAKGDPIKKLNVLFDGKSIGVTSENKLEVNIDGTTLYYSDSEKCLKASGVEVKPGEAVTITRDPSSTATKTINKVDVLYDDKTIKLDAAGNFLFVDIDSESIVVDGTVKVNAGKALEVDGAVNVLTDSETVIVNGDNKLEVKYDAKTIVLGADGLELPIDKITIKLNSEGKLESMGVKEGEAIEFEQSEGLQVISVKYDDVTVKLSSENELFIPIDEITIKVNSEGKLQAAGVEAGEAIELIDSENTGVNKINVLYDDETIKLGADNHLYLPIDSETIYISSEGLLKARPELLKSGIATDIYYDSEGYETVDVVFDTPLYINSEGELSVKYDHTTIVLDSEDALHVAIDEKSLYFDTTEEAIKVSTLTRSDILRICV